MEKNPILYVILNKELNMSAGKASAQAVHAAMMLENNYSGLFASSYKRTVVVLEAENSEQIKNLYVYLGGAGIFADYYIDEGVNEVSAYSVTAMAVEPIDSGDKEKRAIFEQFNLFSTPIAPAPKRARDALEDIVDAYTGFGDDIAPKAVRSALKHFRRHV